MTQTNKDKDRRYADAINNLNKPKTMNTDQQTVFPVITLYQPWATWIMREWKLIETRTHDKFKSLIHRTILIHAGMRTDDSDEVIKNPYLKQEEIIYNPNEVINGFILGSAYVEDFDIVEPHESKDALIDCINIKRYGLYLAKINKFKIPIPVRGEMGIWYFDLSSMQKIKKPKQSLSLKLF